MLLKVNKNIDYDPRPQPLIKQDGYETFFKNTIVNSGVMCAAPVAQILQPANPLGVLMDHDYHCKDDPIESFLQREKITEISQMEADALQRATVGQSINQTWKAERLKRLTSSMFGRICKMTERTNGVVLARSLLVDREIMSAAVRHGRTYELEAVQKYEKQTGKVAHECGLFVSTDYPFLCASPDRILEGNCLLEVKCPYTAKNKPITPVTVPYLELSNGKLALKSNHDYYYQVQGQMLCTGASCVEFAIYTMSDLCVVSIARNDEFIRNMTDKLAEFFRHFFRWALINKYLAANYFDRVMCHCNK